MKNSSRWLLALLGHLLAFNLQAETAQTTLVCYSIQVHSGNGPGGNTLELTTSPSVINEELAPQFASYSHFSYFLLDDGFFLIEGVMDLNVPLGLDDNDNGFDDFFETSQGVLLTTTSGIYDTGLTEGTIQANWNRSAGSKNGTCVLTLTDDDFGPLGSFSHSFELLEYKGPLNYVPGATNVTGIVALTRTDSPAETLQGAVNFIKSDLDPFDELELQPGGWTDASAGTLTFADSLFLRDFLRTTNYYGFVFFDDGNLATGDLDYTAWQMSIDDINDTDHDEIPNFSDTPAGGGARRPVLTLARNASNLLLTISGDVGRLHHILGGTNFVTGNWQTNLSVTLTNDPQTVSLPLPTTNVKYWRALVP